MKPTYLVLGIALIALLLAPVSALEENATIYTGETTIVTDSNYLDINIWYFLTSIGAILIVLSNRVKSEPENALYAWSAIPFLLISARYALMLQTTDTYSVFDTSTSQIHIQIVKTVQHPEWVAILMGIVFLIAIVNAFYISTKKTVERPSSMSNNNNADAE